MNHDSWINPEDTLPKENSLCWILANARSEYGDIVASNATLAEYANDVFYVICSPIRIPICDVYRWTMVKHPPPVDSIPIYLKRWSVN